MNHGESGWRGEPAVDRKDSHAILGVSRNAGAKEIQRAFHELAKKFHPDKNPGSQTAESQFKKISAAYEAIRSTDGGVEDWAESVTNKGPEEYAKEMTENLLKNHRDGSPADPYSAWALYESLQFYSKLDPGVFNKNQPAIYAEGWPVWQQVDYARLLKMLNENPDVKKLIEGRDVEIDAVPGAREAMNEMLKESLSKLKD